jgi:hypothetical protein
VSSWLLITQTIILQRRTGNGFYEAIIRDPDGNLIELVAE